MSVGKRIFRIDNPALTVLDVLWSCLCVLYYFFVGRLHFCQLAIVVVVVTFVAFEVVDVALYSSQIMHDLFDTGFIFRVNIYVVVSPIKSMHVIFLFFGF